MEQDQKEHAASVLRDLQAHIGDANKAKGFSEEYELLVSDVESARRSVERLASQSKLHQKYAADTLAAHESALRNHQIMALALITTEASEAIEELRKGNAIDKTYYPTQPYVDDDGKVRNSYSEPPYKPEGVPSELADIVIRAFDLSAKAGIDLAAMIFEKLEYNESRGYKHGKTC